MRDLFLVLEKKIQLHFRKIEEAKKKIERKNLQ